jgi:hydroxymethylpyrimidine/phosphomethylpyrimidine kinase
VNEWGIIIRGVPFGRGVRSALTVAGSDSGGGAGIQADLKSFAAVGVHGCSVLTCVTAQNTRGVESIFPLPVREIERQLHAVISDFDIRAAKTGMLYSAEIVKSVSSRLRKCDFPILVDPVMIATVGDSLQKKDFKGAVVRDLLPMSRLVTPNLYEAGQLADMQVRTVEEMREAAKAIRELGAEAVLVKGGHLRGKLVDVLYDGGRFHEMTGYRFAKGLHGAGCTLGASITAYLATGLGVRASVEAARKRVAAGFQTSYRAGKGVEVINSHFRPDRFEVWREVTQAAEELTGILPPEYLPEVGMNIGYAVEGAADSSDVCALTGRIYRVGTGLKVGGHADFGASKHISRIILAAMATDPRLRSAANLKYREETLRRAKTAGLLIGTFSRREQPEGTSTMEWGTAQAIRKQGRVPDVIYDLGDVGKEAMIRVIGRNPRDILRKMRMLA